MSLSNVNVTVAAKPPLGRREILPPPPEGVVAKALGLKSVAIGWLAGDGSDRCYYRVTSPERTDSLVLMQLSGQDAELLKQDEYDWIKVARILSAQGVFVPEVITTLRDNAAIVIQDYGDVMLEGRVQELAAQDEWPAIREMYRRCSSIVGQFLKVRPDPSAVWCKRSFDEDRYIWELHFFQKKYLNDVAGIILSKAEQDTFAREVHALAQDLAAQSRYFVHRDFHSRNIMAQGDKLAIIDFQDARLGSPAYDLVSLCFDSYVPFSGAFRRQIFADGLKVLGVDVAQTWKSVLLQRQIKAIGSFGYLTVDKGRGDYLKYVDPALRTLEEAEVYDERWPFLSGELLQSMRRKLVAG